MSRTLQLKPSAAWPTALCLEAQQLVTIRFAQVEKVLRSANVEDMAICHLTVPKHLTMVQAMNIERIRKGMALTLAKGEIDKISEKYQYKDEKPNGDHDRELVACGQCKKNGNSYSELEHVFEHDLYPLIKAKLISQEQALKALDKACRELPVRKERTRFHQFLADALGHKVADATPKLK